VARILVADISRPDGVRSPVAAFLGIPSGQPPPQRVEWRGHEVIIAPEIPETDAWRLRPDAVFALMGWDGIASRKPPALTGLPYIPIRAEVYEHFYDASVPVFTWGDDSWLPYLMRKIDIDWEGRVPERRFEFVESHPLLEGLRPEDFSPCGGKRTIVRDIQPGVRGLMREAEQNYWVLLVLEERGKRWVHLHTCNCPPQRFTDNLLKYLLQAPPSPLPPIEGFVRPYVVAIIAAAGLGAFAAAALRRRRRR
jgi:MYXO-CTERM domain-containing protein